MAKGGLMKKGSYFIYKCLKCTYYFDAIHSPVVSILTVCPNDFSILDEEQTDYIGQNDAICDRCDAPVHCEVNVNGMG
jgi:hypothetical protein